MNVRDALLVVLFFCASSLLSAEEIRVSLQLQPNQRDTFERIFQQFQVETGIKVVSVVETDLGYKRKVPVWLIEGKDTPDVMFWSASQRLYLYAEKGLVSFRDARVQNVLLEWKRLIDSHFYNEDHENYDWDGVLPFFYRNKMGFMLLGNFVASRWPVRDPLFEDIGFMPFPTINRGIPYYENAPTDVFMIPKSTTKVAEAKAFLRFMARADVQITLNKDLGYLPPNREATVGEDRFIRDGAELISRAAGLAQYFDRDTPPAFDELATPLLADYISTGNIDALTEGLEAARITIFGLTPNPQDSQPVP